MTFRSLSRLFTVGSLSGILVRTGLCAVLFMLSAGRVSAQVVDLPITHEAYDFLDRMEAKGHLTGFRDAIRPIPRSVFARQLDSLRRHRTALTSYELEEMDFLMEEFRPELLQLTGDTTLAAERWHLATFPTFGGRMTVGLIAAVETKRDGERTFDKRTSGFQLFGTAYEHVGYYFNTIQSNEHGTLANAARTHTPDQGFTMLNLDQRYGLEYNDIQSAVSYDLGRVNIAIEQTMNTWGNDRFGSLIFSTKAPAFPKLKLRFAVTDWLDFTYIHGELFSNVIDSTRSYHAGDPALAPFFRKVYRSKFIASHALELSLWGAADLLLGESIVYSDKGPLLIYLLPVTFFNQAETYNRDTDNAQLFASVEVPTGYGITFSGTLFIDELSRVGLGDSARARNHLGVTAGISLYDLPMDALDLSFEYTRINPWVYSHKYPAATYTNNGFTMGHWIGQNADLLTMQATYHPFRPVRARLTFQLYRKGDTTDISNQYAPPSEPFLYGRQHVERSMTMAVAYQPVHDAVIEASYRYGPVQDDQRPLPSRTVRHEVMFRLRYGIW